MAITLLQAECFRTRRTARPPFRCWTRHQITDSALSTRSSSGADADSSSGARVDASPRASSDGGSSSPSCVKGLLAMFIAPLTGAMGADGPAVGVAYYEGWQTAPPTAIVLGSEFEVCRRPR